MKLDLPRNLKIRIPNVEISNGFLIIGSSTRFEDLMYELTILMHPKRCAYCGKRLKKNNLTIDHLYPRAVGGPSITNNLVLACGKCNCQKGDLLTEEFEKFQQISLKKEKKNFLKKIKQNRENYIFPTQGFTLPKKWVSFVNIAKLTSNETDYIYHGKNYLKIETFYKKYHQISKPIITDSNYFVIDGFNTYQFCVENQIKIVPIIRLENVVVI